MSPNVSENRGHFSAYITKAVTRHPLLACWQKQETRIHCQLSKWTLKGTSRPSIGGSALPAASAGVLAGAPAAAGTRETTSTPTVADDIGGSVFSPLRQREKQQMLQPPREQERRLLGLLWPVTSIVLGVVFSALHGGDDNRCFRYRGNNKNSDVGTCGG